MKRIVRWIALGLAGMAALAYGFDAVSLNFRNGASIYEDIRVDQVYTDTNKWHELEYSRGNPVMERCVNALFPHSGFRPCWYVKRHTMNTTSTD